MLARARGAGLAVAGVRTAKVYLVEGLSGRAAGERVANALLADPVVERATFGAAPTSDQIVEVHPLPGVMDPVAQSVQEAVRALTGEHVRVSTGVRYDLAGVTGEQAAQIAQRLLANRVIHRVEHAPFMPDALPRGQPYEFALTTVPLRGKSDAELEAFSREAHLFMSLEELRAVRDHYETLGREPTDIELETIAQTWSEHCVHKTLKSRVEYREPKPAPRPPRAPGSAPPARSTASFEFTPTGRAGESTRPAPQGEGGPAPAPAGGPDWSERPGTTVREDGVIVIDNLLKHTVAAATMELIRDGVDWTLSVFKDNSGVVAFDDTHAVNIKVETHNRPSALEPYGGAATGAGGCIRDVIGTGLGARPIANTDVFCVADPASWSDAAGSGKTLPPGTLHPRRILTDVVAGVRDYGNRMGIPTVNGAVYFDDRYVGNPLVFCGCVGLLPRDLVAGKARPGDRVVALGGRTGRDGIHGATFSSAELQHTHADEFAHAVQIGNAIEEKRLLDAVLRARDAGPLYSAITDCGAGGFSSAVGEMGAELGAEVHLDLAPLKYEGLSYTEIWISESQERMILAVPPGNMDALRAICAEEGVTVADLGAFGTPGRTLDLFYDGAQVGQLSMAFLHDGLPMPTRRAAWTPPGPGPAVQTPVPSISDALPSLLATPNIASKHWIIRQYDHEVQGNTVTRPLVGPAGRGPSDAAVLEPVPGTSRGIAIACGLAVGVGDRTVGGDPYQMALHGIDECVRNLVCAGADPNRVAILDNFCWPSCDKPENMGALVRACLGCYDGAKAYRTPFVSGKDSLNNQLRYTDPATGDAKVIEIPPTLLITGLGIVRNIARCVTMDAKQPGNLLVVVGRTTGHMGGSQFQRLFGVTDPDARAVPAVDLSLGPSAAKAVAQAITDGLIVSAHDCSDGGVLCAVAEMLIATTGGGDGGPAHTSALASLLAADSKKLKPLGADLTLDDDLLERWQVAFAETPSRYVVEIRPDDLPRLRTVLRDYGGVHAEPIGKITNSGRLRWPAADLDAGVNDLARAWRGTLDW